MLLDSDFACIRSCIIHFGLYYSLRLKKISSTFLLGMSQIDSAISFSGYNQFTTLGTCQYIHSWKHLLHLSIDHSCVNHSFEVFKHIIVDLYNKTAICVCTCMVKHWYSTNRFQYINIKISLTQVLKDCFKRLFFLL